MVALHHEGYLEQLISQRIKRKNAVHNAVAKFQQAGTFSDAKKSGRSREITPRDNYAIRKIAVRSPMSSACKIRSELLAKGANIIEKPRIGVW